MTDQSDDIKVVDDDVMVFKRSYVYAILLPLTFLLGLAIERVGVLFPIDQKTLTSLILLGTLKNYGLAGGLALALFSKRTAVPATVSVVFMIIYIIWLGYKRS